MNKVVLGAVMTVAVVSVAYAGWWSWGSKGDDAKGTAIETTKAAPAAAAEPVKVPEFISGTLPPGHPLGIQKFDVVMGQEDAPVTIIEYASMTCPHCAHFHATTLQEIEKEWIDTGKAKYVLRDLPWDNLALGISKVTRCADKAMFYPLVSAYFASQEEIVKGVDTLGEIKKVARMAGMDGAKVEACIADGPSQALITGIKDNALTQLKVTGTPTTFVNGVKVDGAVEYKDIKPTLEGAYKAAMIAKQEMAAQEQSGTPISPTVK